MGDGDPLYAFLVCCGAGLSTCLGAAIVFFPRLVERTNRVALAAWIAVSAGVMIYVSLVEILVQAQNTFVKWGVEQELAYVYATLCLFGGVAFFQVLEYLLNLCNPNPLPESLPSTPARQEKATSRVSSHEQQEQPGSGCQCKDRASCMCIVVAPAATSPASCQSRSRRSCDSNSGSPVPGPHGCHTFEARTLQRMGTMTALTVGLHNVPEGVATFVGMLADPQVGATLGIAIAIHNIPEGLCVAIPIYYATGSRSQAFLWAFISGISEPVAGAFAWLVLKDVFNDLVCGILFGFTAGLMIAVAVQELLPTAMRYDPANKTVSLCIFAGMAIMALSLCLFLL